MPKFIYTAKKLEEEFGKTNVIIQKIGNITYSSVDVSAKNTSKNIVQELSKLGLIFSEKHKQSGPGSFELQLRENSGYNVCLIIESSLKNEFSIMIQQINDISVIGTIAYYICKDNTCYRLNHWNNQV